MARIKEFQAKIKVEDSLVEEIIRESTRSFVEARLEKATQCLKQRGRVRDYSDLVKVNLICSVALSSLQFPFELCQPSIPSSYL